jgi:hypothetical protein
MFGKISISIIFFVCFFNLKGQNRNVYDSIRFEYISSYYSTSLELLVKMYDDSLVTINLIDIFTDSKCFQKKIIIELDTIIKIKNLMFDTESINVEQKLDVGDNLIFYKNGKSKRLNRENCPKEYYDKFLILCHWFGKTGASYN